jgi:hypothetical protein
MTISLPIRQEYPLKVHFFQRSRLCCSEYTSHIGLVILRYTRTSFHRQQPQQIAVQGIVW